MSFGIRDTRNTPIQNHKTFKCSSVLAEYMAFTELPLKNPYFWKDYANSWNLGKKILNLSLMSVEHIRTLNHTLK